MDGWAKSLSPGDELRNWFGHDPEKWEEFQVRYFAELDKKPGAWLPLLQAARKGDLTLLFSAHNSEHNNAVALRRYLMRALKKRPGIRRSKLISV